jgi:hypothetical protein
MREIDSYFQSATPNFYLYNSLVGIRGFIISKRLSFVIFEESRVKKESLELTTLLLPMPYAPFPTLKLLQLWVLKFPGLLVPGWKVGFVHLCLSTRV